MTFSPLDHTVTLRNGVRLPLLGLGTYRLRDEKCYNSVRSALDCGYRLIDTASVYRNEAQVGKAVNDAIQNESVSRKDLFITSKLAPRDQGFDKASVAFQQSLSELGLPFMDCFLIHWPGKQKTPKPSPINAESRAESWRALERVYDEGLTRSIGVSNYTERHLIELLEHCSVKPHLLQIELHPLIWPLQQSVVRLCHEEGIRVQAYSSFGEGRFLGTTFDLPSVEDPLADIAIQKVQQEVDRLIANYHPPTTRAPVLLRWAVEKGFAVIPKSSSYERMLKNASSLDLNMDTTALDRLESEPVRFCWDPTDVK